MKKRSYNRIVAIAIDGTVSICSSITELMELGLPIVGTGTVPSANQ